MEHESYPTTLGYKPNEKLQPTQTTEGMPEFCKIGKTTKKFLSQKTVL